MKAGDKLFARLLGRPPSTELATAHSLVMQNVGLHVQLDHQGHVVDLSGPLRHLLSRHLPADGAGHLANYLLPHSRQAVEGVPVDWQGQSLDLDFPRAAGDTLHLRGWTQPNPDGWLLQLLDIGDLVRERQQAQGRVACQQFAEQAAEQLRLCSTARLPEVLLEQLQSLAQLLRIPCVALALPNQDAPGWRIFSQYRAHDAADLWHTGQPLGTLLEHFTGQTPQHLGTAHNADQDPRLLDIFGHHEGFLVPYRDARGTSAWLLCGFYPVLQRAPQLGERDWLQLAAALAEPLLNRLREQQHLQQLERLDALQDLLGSGWWECPEGTDEIHLAPHLAQTLGLPHARLALDEWLALLHPVLMILFVTCSTLGSQLLIKHAVTALGARNPAPRGVEWLVAALTSPTVMLAIAVQAVGFVVWVVVALHENQVELV